MNGYLYLKSKFHRNGQQLLHLYVVLRNASNSLVIQKVFHLTAGTRRIPQVYELQPCERPYLLHFAYNMLIMYKIQILYYFLLEHLE